MGYKSVLPAIAVAAAVATGVVVGAAPALAQKSDIVFGQLQFNPNWHPLIQVNNTKRNGLGFINHPITAWDEKQNNVCRLCEEVPSLENGLAKIVDNPDGSKGMEVTIKLREGLKWGDGEPVTANDIAFTWEVAADPKVGFSNYNPWTRADKATVVDDRTIVMHLPKVVSGYASWDHIIPEHLERPVWEKVANAEEYVKQSHYNSDTTNPGLWNGPFVIGEFQPGTIIEFKKNPGWPGPGPASDRVILQYRDNSAALMQNLLADALDVLSVSPGGISFSQMLEIRKQYPDRFKYWVEPGSNLERINVNLDNPALADVRVRKALMHGLDRQAIVDALFGGLQDIANGPVSPVSERYCADCLDPYEFNPDKARALLAEAGWKPGSDGICVNDAGDRLAFDFVTTVGNRTREQIAQVVQNQWKDICVETVNKFVELREFSGVLQRRRQFTGLMMGSINFPPSSSPAIVFSSKRIPSESNNYVGNNFSGYKNAEMDAAVAKAESALTAAESKEAWAEVQRIFSRDLPLLPLYIYARSYVTAPNMEGFRAGAVDPASTWSEEWHLK